MDLTLWYYTNEHVSNAISGAFVNVASMYKQSPRLGCVERQMKAISPGHTKMHVSYLLKAQTFFAYQQTAELTTEDTKIDQPTYV